MQEIKEKLLRNETLTKQEGGLLAQIIDDKTKV